MERLAGQVILLWGWRRALTAFLAGALAVLSQAPYDFFAVCFVSFPVLVWLLDGATAEPGAGRLRRMAPAFATGWWFGFGYFTAGLWWTGAALLVEAEEYAWALPVAVIALPAVLALFYGLAAVLARLGWHDDMGRIFALAAAFGFAEWVRSFAFTGFPWNAIGYAATPVPVLMQSASVIGLFGMNALAALLFSLPALAGGTRYRRAGLALAVFLAVIHVGYGYWRLSQPMPRSATTVTVRVVQPAVDQAAKWDAAFRTGIMDRLLEMTARAPEPGKTRPNLVVWPETAVPYLITERPEVLSAIGETLQDGQVLLTGAVREEGTAGSDEARYYNSVVAIDAAGQIVDAADKVHLVPFGEYLPFAHVFDLFGIKQLVEAPGTFSAAVRRKAIALPDGVSVLPWICYEAIFPGEAQIVDGPVNLIVNVTNDAWYGDTPGPWQHLRQAQLRAVEAGLPLIRAANNGISAIVDSRGRIKDAFSLNVTGDLDATLDLPAAQASTPSFPSRNGLLTILALALITTVFSILAGIRLN